MLRTCYQLILKNKYKDPKPFIHDYNNIIAKKIGVTAGGIFKTGFFTLLSAPVAGSLAAGTALLGTTAAGMVSTLNKIKGLSGAKNNQEFAIMLDQDPDGVAKKLEKHQDTMNKHVQGEVRKTLMTTGGTYAFVVIAVIVGIIGSNIRGKSKQGKMILQCACDAWNDNYDKKISINYIKKVIKENPIAHKVMKDVKKSKTAEIKKAEAHDKLHFKK